MRQRLFPTSEQEIVLIEHGGQARLVWNLAVEQSSYYRKFGVRTSYPPSDSSSQLTELRNEYDWLCNGSRVVQNQAVRDFDKAVAAAKNPRNPARRPTYRRKKSKTISFNIVGVGPDRVRKINRRYSEVFVPKIGWVRFRKTREFRKSPKSFRITRDRACQWWVSFVDIPSSITSPGIGELVGIDRGVKHAVAVSDGKLYDYGTPTLDKKINRAYRHRDKTQRGSEGQRNARREITRLTTKRKNKRKDFIEKTTTTIAQSYDFIVLEDLKVKNMTRSAKGTVKNPGKNVRQKSGLNRSILDKAWSTFATRLEQKAQGRVEYVPAAYTSQRCSRCGHVSKDNRESQAIFRCKSCLYEINADTNAACNVAEGFRRRKMLGEIRELTEEMLR